MEGIKAEVNAKIRSAIKAKLMELGVYVDEELPDYIMVMVVNKRTKLQMDDDLQLFLGSNTEVFTSWLHQVLQKLEEVTIASLDKRTVKRASIPDTDNGGNKRKLSSASNDNENHRKEKRRKSSSSSLTEVKKGKKSSGEVERGRDTKRDSENTNKSHSKGSEGDKTKSQMVENTNNLSKFNRDAVVSSSADVRVVKKQTSPKGSSVSHKTPAKKNMFETADNVKKNSVKSFVSDPSNSLGDMSCMESQLGAVKSNDRTLKSDGHELVPDKGQAKVADDNKVITWSDKHTAAGHPHPRPHAKGSTNASRGSTYSQSAMKNKIILMHSDDEDDDEDFINIKADAEAEELLNEELPKETLEASVTTTDPVTSVALEPLLPNEDKPSIETPKKVPTIAPVPEPELPACPVTNRLVRKKQPTKAPEVTEKPDVPTLPLSERFSRKRTLEKETVDENKRGSANSSFVNRVAPVVSVKDRLGVKKNTSTSERHPGSEDRIAEHSDRSRSHSSRVTDRLGQRGNAAESTKKRRLDAQASSPERRNAATQVTLSTSEKGVRDKASRRTLDNENTDDSDKKKHSVSSRVVLLRPDREEEYDPANPAVGTVASVVRVKPRPKVPAALQANKNLLLKAMAEAQKSVASVPVRPDPTASTRKHQDGFSSRRSRDSNIAVTLSNRRVQSYRDTTSRDSNTDRVVVPVKLEPARTLKQKIVIQVSSNEPNVQELELGEVTQKDSNTSSPQVAAVDHMDDGPNHTVQVSAEEEDEMLPDEGIVTEEPENEEELTTTYSPVGGTIRTARERSAPQRSDSPQFLVTLDGLDPNMFHSNNDAAEDQCQSKAEEEELEKEVETEMQNVTTPPPKEKGKSVSPIVFTKRDSTSETDSSLPKSLDRCKYWPSCRLGTRCTFHHPTVPCKSFPKCPFREKCLYVHPMCKFDSSCTRRDCPFTHASAYIIAAPVPAGKLRVRATLRSTQVSSQVCKFFPKCSNVSCRFVHPKPCRYGKYCNKQDCNYLHDELPSADKLKWTSPFRV